MAMMAPDPYAQAAYPAWATPQMIDAWGRNGGMPTGAAADDPMGANAARAASYYAPPGMPGQPPMQPGASTAAPASPYAPPAAPWLNNPGAARALAGGDFSFDPTYRAQFSSPWIEGQGPSDPGEAIQHNRDIFSGDWARPPAAGTGPNTYDLARPNAATGGPGAGAAANLPPPGSPYTSWGGGTQTINSNTGAGSGTGWLNSPGQTPAQGGQPAGGPYAPPQYNPAGGIPGMNPALEAQANSVLSGITRNLREQILPSISSGATMNGQYGGSRQGIAEGLAIRGANDSASNAITNLLFNAYESDANRGVQREGYRNTFDIASMGNATQRDIAGGQLGLGYAGLDNQRDIASRNNDIQRYSIDSNFLSNLLGQGTQRDIASMGNATTIRGQDLNHILGRGQLDLGFYGADTNRLGTMGNLDIGRMNADTNRVGTNNAFTLGLLNNQLGNRTADNNYNLGMGGLYNQGRTIDQNGQRLGADLLTSSINNGINVNNQLWTQGQRDLYAPLGPLSAIMPLLQGVMPYTGTGTATTPGTGGGLAGGLGGALTAAQLYSFLFGGGRP